MKKILFRADGNTEIGLGHIIRSLALAEMLKGYFECIFVTRFINDYIKVEIEKSCSGYIQLKENEHMEEFLEIIDSRDIVVLDNYFFNTEYQKAIKDKGAKLICIDDMHNKHYIADILINHAPGLKKEDFSVEEYTVLCLGFEYALLRKPFLEEFQETETRRDNIFISFGGSDLYNLTERITLEVLKYSEKYNKVFVLLGPNYEHKQQFKAKYAKYESILIFQNLKAFEIRDLMDNCKYAIVPSSSILIECLSRGLKIITGYYAENQKEFYTSLTNTNMVLGIGNFFNFEEIEKELAKKMNTISNWNNSSNYQFKGLSDRYVQVFQNL